MSPVVRKAMRRFLERLDETDVGRSRVGGLLLGSLDTDHGWLAYFAGGLELEVRLDGPRPVATWSGVGWRVTWRARWGMA